jgi:5-methylcytosine-specific restriction endonuclease McrA
MGGHCSAFFIAMKYPDDFQAMILEEVERGLSYREIREKHGVAASTIRRWRYPEYHAQSLEMHKAWKKNNPEKMTASQRNWRKNQPEKAKAKDRRHYHRSYEKYPHRFHERSAKYRAIKRKNHCPMCEIEKMMCRNYYAIARELTEQTGIKHEVDHIWPISKGGPHLPWNLQVLTQEENRKKHDKT